jgi:uncharacterized protein (DUF2345 family)
MAGTLYGGIPKTYTPYDDVRYYETGQTLPSGKVSAYTFDYPSSNVLTTFGPLLTPKIHASTFDALELASSGKVAITLNDEHALDISEASEVVTIRARDSNSLTLSNESGTGFLTLGDNGNLEAAGPSLVLGDASTTNIDILSTSNVDISADQTLNLSTADLLAQTSNSATIASSNLVEVSASSNVSVQSGGDFLFAASNAGTVQTGGALAVDAGAALTATAVGDASLSSAAGVSVTASNSFGVAAAADVLLAAGNDASFAASNAGSFSTGTTLLLDAGTSMTTSVGEDLSFDVGSNVTYTTACNFSVATGDSISMTSSNGDVLIQAPNGTLTLKAAVMDIDGQVDLVGDAEIQMGSLQSNVDIFAETDLSVTASNGDITIDTLVGDLAMASAADASLSASNILTLQGDQVKVIGDRTVHIESTTETATFVSGSNMHIGASNDLSIASPADVFVSGSDLNFSAASAAQTLFKVGNHNFMTLREATPQENASGSNLTGYVFTVNADVDFQGALNSTSYTETSLEVVDKVIHLAYNSNLDMPVDGNGNDQAGIIVDGFPQSIFTARGSDPANITADDLTKYQKSILWHDPMGGTDVGTLGDPANTVLTNEPYWEMKGGQFRITATLKNLDTVTYGFRINHNAELELFKSHTFDAANPGTTYEGKRIAKFGRVL